MRSTHDRIGARQRFLVSLVIYATVLCAAIAVLSLLAGLTGGAMGQSAAVLVLGAFAGCITPGAVAAALVVTWLGRTGHVPRRGTAAWLSAALSAASLTIVYGILALNADKGPDPWTTFDQRPLLIFFASIAGVIGLIAGVCMASLAAAWERSDPSMR